MKVPGPDHPISITPSGKHIRVTAGDIVVADTTKAVTLKEATYPDVFYIPRSDANMDAVTRTERVTHCLTRETRIITASKRVTRCWIMPSGLMKRPSRPWRGSRTISLSIRTR